MACQEGHVSTAQLLIERGGFVERSPDGEFTALTLASTWVRANGFFVES